MADSKPSILKTFLAVGIVSFIGIYLVSTSAFYPLPSVSGYDAKRILQLGLIVFSLGLAVLWTPLRHRSINHLKQIATKLKALLIAFFAIGIASSLQLIHPMYALIDVSMLVLLTCMIVVTAASRDLAPRLFDKLAVISIAVLGGAVFIQEFMGYTVGWITGNEFSYKEALMHFAHPRFYNQLQTWFIPIIGLLPLLFPAQRRIKLLSIILLGFQWFLVISLAARGTTTSLFCAAIFIAFWMPESRRYWLKLHFQGIATGMVIYLGFLLLNNLLIPKSDSGAFLANSVGRPMIHTSGRSSFWELSLSEALKSPWLGNGPAHYACELKSWIAAHPHSFPMQILGEWGFPATILLLVFGLLVGFGYLRSLKSNENENPTVVAKRAILAISLIAGLIHACLSGILVMPASQVAFILVGALALSLSNGVQILNEHQSRHTLALIISSAISLTLFIVSINELKHLPERTAYTQDLGAINPRFWQDGKVCQYDYELGKS